LQAAANNPITAFLQQQDVMILDGGLATALEARGHNLDDDLWSARVLLDAPDEIREVHTDFLRAGADCITTSTYQASVPGFRKRGLTDNEAVELLHRSVQLAVEARDTFWKDSANRRGRIRPLVAASVGPYGAFLADGSEYSGRYDIGTDELTGFHRQRWQVLADSDADLLACETIPSQREVAVLLELLKETPERWAWMSVSCRDDQRLSDGSMLSDIARACDAAPGVAAIGVNCTAPQYIPSLIGEVRNASTKPVVVYPNSGERYQAEKGKWVGEASRVDWQAAPSEWARLGASCIGGCCRVGAGEIATARRVLAPRPAQ
jgi:homocysteine S-methyltransferase